MSIELYNGDCLDIMPTLPSGSIDLILADLPYGTTQCSWDSVLPLESLWKEYKRLIKPKGAIVLTASQPFTSALVMSNPKWFRCEWVWVKTRASNFGAARYQPMKYHESILVFSHHAPTYLPLMVVGEPYHTRTTSRKVIDGVFGQFRQPTPPKQQRNTRQPSSVLCFPSMRQQDRRHPSEKPVALMEYLIRTYTNEGDMVLDNTMGSGTTGVACIRTGRDFIGIEKDRDYFRIAEERLAEAQRAPLQAQMEWSA